MKMTALATRYADAILGQAKELNAVDKVESDLGLLAYSLRTMPKLNEALAHPLIAAKKKKQIAAEVFENKVDQVALDFMGLLIDKRRVNLIEGIEEEYVRLANEYRGVTPALVTSAVPITKEEQRLLQQKLEVFTGKRVELSIEEDSALIGGLIVRIGDTIIDGSVRGYLSNLKEKLLEMGG